MTNFIILIQRIAVFLGVLFLLQMITSQPAFAQQDQNLQIQSNHSLLISYQGRLTDSNGNAVADGNHTIVFSLYDQKTGGTALWKETQNIETSNGVFSAQLGSVNSIDTLTFNRPFYLGIKVDGGNELTPRSRLTTVPYAQRAHSIDDSTVSTGKLTGEAVTTSKIDRNAVTTEKLDYGAVDSASIHPDAVFKTLDPTLKVDPSDAFVGVNQKSPLTGSSTFGVTYQGGFADGYGGMYVNTENSEGWPFYGYATGGTAQAWHHYDDGEQRWRLVFDGASPEVRMIVDKGGVKPGGDDALQLGSSNHRWSAVYATNGTIQTSDRRLKTDINGVDYGLQEIMALNPVEYRWKKDVRQSNHKARKHLGLIAQDVQKVISEVVKKPGKEEGYLGMNYSELVPVLVKAIQEQQAQIEKLQNKLNNRPSVSKAQLKALQKKVTRLAEQMQEKGKSGNGLTSTSR